jgi:hypothetical protein
LHRVAERLLLLAGGAKQVRRGVAGLVRAGQRCLSDGSAPVPLVALFTPYQLPATRVALPSSEVNPAVSGLSAAARDRSMAALLAKLVCCVR